MDKNQKRKEWRASQKTDIVIRLLKGEALDYVSREIGVPAYKLEQWKQDFIDSGREGLRRKPRTKEAAELDRAKKIIADLTMDNELLNWRLEKSSPLAGRRSLK